MLKTKEIVRADVFVVPNCSLIINERTFESTRSDLYRIFSLNEDALEGDFLDQVWAQVWFCTPGGQNQNSNWRDHGIDGYRELEGDGRNGTWRPISMYLPKTLFKGYKEGDTVTFRMPIDRNVEINDGNIVTEISSIMVSLCLKQRGYRYERYGKFEEVLARV